ncbi:cation efflux family-domain-containing protein [Helicostylum pulchrum]|nr:cation efflux family-domain-containing protein [Helicostylum pulchrum]
MSTTTQTIESIQLKHRNVTNCSLQAEEHELTLNDPLSLKDQKTADDYIRVQLKGKKKLQNFYQNQNDMIDNMLTALDEGDDDEEQNQLLKVCILKIAIYGSVAANILLFILQLVAAVTSGCFYGLVKFCCIVMGFQTSIEIERNKGKSRMETVGIIVFSCLMSCVALFLIVEASQKLGESNQHSPDLTPLAIGFVSAALAVKLVLYIYCKTLSQFSSARVLAQDHRNDLFVNALGLTTGIVGSKIAGWVDPVGSIVIALIILQSWTSTLFEHIPLVVGRSADPSFLNLITYIALTHPGVVQVDTCKAYHAGNSLFVEVDIVLPPNMELRTSHDIGEALQQKLESLPDVERAFVHVDYETLHKPEHQKSK